jgi:hypothetical protein
MTCVPVHGKSSMTPWEPSGFTSMDLIQRRPYSAAKNRPSSDAGNFTPEARSGSKR